VNLFVRALEPLLPSLHRRRGLAPIAEVRAGPLIRPAFAPLRRGSHVARTALRAPPRVRLWRPRLSVLSSITRLAGGFVHGRSALARVSSAALCPRGFACFQTANEKEQAMKLEHLTLDQLKLAPVNVRKKGGKEVDDLVPSIRSLGII